MMRSMTFALAACAALGTAATASAAPTLRLDDLRKIVSLSAPQISPDGSRVAVLVKRSDYNKDVVVTDLVLVDVATRASHVLVHDGKVSQASWSPSGDTIAYIATPKYGDDKTPQLFLLPLSGGEPVQLTHDKYGVDDAVWRPDGKALAYSAHTSPPDEKAIEQHQDAFNVTEEAWTAQNAPTPDYLYEISARQAAPARRIGNGTWSVGGDFTYASNGSALFVTRITAGAQRNQYLSREIVRVDVKSGSISRLPALSSTQENPLRSPDGRYIAYGFSNPRGTMQVEVALADGAGQHPRMVTQRLDRNAGDISFTPDDNLIVTANDGTQSRMFRVANNGNVKRIELGDLNASPGSSVARNGTIAFIGVSPDRPGELCVLKANAAAPQRLSDYNAWIRPFAIGKAREITWKTDDGLTADGVLISPPNWRAGTRAPLALVIHGGPTAASLRAFAGFAQLLAAHGWFIFEPNYRGSDNLGLKFARTTVPHIASVPGKDIEGGLAAVLRLNLVDSSRIGVSGWSEGGLMTSWLITHDTRWKAAVSGAAVNDWIGYSAMTDAKDFTPQFIGPSQWTNPALYSTFDDESPLTYASNVRTPTLILSDSGDYRVPTPLAYEFYHDVRATGTPVQMVIWPVIGHFPTDPVRIEDVYRHWQDWLVKYL